MKSDPDTYVHLRAVSARLDCFDGEGEHFLGAAHAVLPPPGLRDIYSTLFFGQGGVGYVFSRGVLRQVGEISDSCLHTMVTTNGGTGMEDVILAACLRFYKIEVMNLGFLSNDPRLWESGERTQEFIVNFHQARSPLLNGTGDRKRQRQLKPTG